MKHVTANTAQKDFCKLLDNVTRYNEPVTVVSDDDKVAVIVSMEEWRGILETLHLQSIPGMKQSIIEGKATPLSDCLDSVGWDIN